MNEIRVKFTRGDEVKYISHLDLMKVFERAARRAGVPILYSQGYNPHAQMVFGLPLSVGVTSEAEYGDFKLEKDMQPQDFMNLMNKSLPRGLNIQEAHLKTGNSNIMADIVLAAYDVLVASEEKMDFDAINKYVQEFLEQPELKVLKEGKKGLREIDIRPMIKELQGKVIPVYYEGNALSPEAFCINPWLAKYVDELRGTCCLSYKPENVFCISALLSAGSESNLKPELLVAAFEKYACKGLKLVKIHRRELFVKRGNKTILPMENEALIS